jgi:hypothetical protein
MPAWAGSRAAARGRWAARPAGVCGSPAGCQQRAPPARAPPPTARTFRGRRDGIPDIHSRVWRLCHPRIGLGNSSHRAFSARAAWRRPPNRTATRRRDRFHFCGFPETRDGRRPRGTAFPPRRPPPRAAPRRCRWRGPTPPQPAAPRKQPARCGGPRARGGGANGARRQQHGGGRRRRPAMRARARRRPPQGLHSPGGGGLARANRRLHTQAAACRPLTRTPAPSPPPPSPPAPAPTWRAARAAAAPRQPRSRASCCCSRSAARALRRRVPSTSCKWRSKARSARASSSCPFSAAASRARAARAWCAAGAGAGPGAARVASRRRLQRAS